jgi:hypothetical protein
MSDQSDYCQKLKDFLEIERKIIIRHIDDHKWFNKIEDKNEGVADFIQKYGWIIKEMYCTYMCENKDGCALKKELDEARAV